jgi:sulfate transport system ATP-binding protein
MSIEVRGVTKTFGTFTAVNDVSLRVPDGELVALLGPSGSGKTSLLRIIAGLERPERGQVLFEGQDATRRDARERRVGFVFQHYALFRHLSVFENVAFGLRVRPRATRPSEAAIREKVRSLLRMVQLDWLSDRLPSQLSGGQRQRVALARALAVEPRVLLLDEPFGSLDAKVRQELRRWLRRLHDEIHLTSVFVTHDQEEALEVADRVVVMNQGRIEQTGSPDEIFDHPATSFVIRFMGNVNVFHGRVQNGKAHLGPLALDYPDHPHPEARVAAGFTRPYDLDVERTAESNGGFWATLRHATPAGAVVRLQLVGEDGAPLQVEIPRDRHEALRPQLGERLYLRPRQVRVFLEPPRGRGGPGQAAAAVTPPAASLYDTTISSPAAGGSMPRRAVANFMIQQGFVEEPPDACGMHFAGLFFQPRIVFPTVIAAILLQLVSIPWSAGLHLAVSAVLWWNALVPARNPFELAYNRWVARRKGRRELVPAPTPRRFAQGMAAALSLGAALALLSGALPVARALQAFMVVAFAALLFGKLCLGAYVYHLLKGRAAFAKSTLPWA